MITQVQVSTYIEESLPEIKPQLQKAAGPATVTVYGSIQCLTDFTRRMVKEHNTAMAGRCLSIASKLYTKGNTVVKNAVETIYVYSFSSLLSSCNDFRERNKLQAAMPADLYRVYVQQVTKSGI